MYPACLHLPGGDKRINIRMLYNSYVLQGEIQQNGGWAGRWGGVWVLRTFTDCVVRDDSPFDMEGRWRQDLKTRPSLTSLFGTEAFLEEESEREGSVAGTRLG